MGILVLDDSVYCPRWEDLPDPPPLEQVIDPLAVCKCGSHEYKDVPIHGGASRRRDCARCRRFLSFPIWYGVRK